MKKYLLKITALTLFIGVFTSCEEDKVVYDVDNGQALVGFVGTESNLKAYDPQEFSIPPEIIVEVGATNRVDHDRAVQVVINEELSDALPSHYTIDQSSFVIPAGEFTAKIKITSDYIALPETQKVTLVLDLISVEEQDIFDEDKSRFTVTLYRVCPREIPANYLGFITGDVGSGTDEFNVTLNPTGEVATYRGGNLWGNFVSGATGDSQYDGQFPYPGTLVINCDNTVDITGGSDDRFPGGTGTFDPNTNEFQLYLNQDLFQQPFIAEVYLIPAP